MRITDELIQNRLRTIFEDDNIFFDKSIFAGGLTNYNYVMNISGSEFVIRKPGGMTNLMIDRGIEKVNTAIACELGINSECFYFDEETGIKVSRYIGNSRNIAQDNPLKPSNIKAVSGLIKRVHSSPKDFPNKFDWKEELVKYESIVKELKGGYFYDYEDLKNRLIKFVDENVFTEVLVPCHNDTVPENFIVNNNGESWLIDWEYAGMNDPSWDFAAYVLESRLNEDAINLFMSEYYGQYPEDKTMTNIKAYMLAQDLLWTVWALIRHYNGEDFLEYCNIRYERFRKNLEAVLTDSDCSLSELANN